MVDMINTDKQRMRMLSYLIFGPCSGALAAGKSLAIPSSELWCGATAFDGLPLVGVHLCPSSGTFLISRRRARSSIWVSTQPHGRCMGERSWGRGGASVKSFEDHSVVESTAITAVHMSPLASSEEPGLGIFMGWTRMDYDCIM